ncbi:MAG: aminodeoxychorismate synthase component I [Ruminiclostridium sp.]
MRTTVKQLDFYIPSELIYDALSTETMSVFLDSSLHNELGQYSIIGLHPYLILKELNEVLYVNDERAGASLEEYLNRYLKQHIETNETKLPLIAGAVGYFSYDHGRRFEQLFSIHSSTMDIPDALFCFYEHYIIEDVIEKRIYLTAKGELESCEISMYHLEQLLEEKITALQAKLRETAEDKTDYSMATFETRYNKSEYIQAVDAIIKYIIEGDIYVCNMTQQLLVHSQKHPFEVYKYLRKHNPSPFGGFYNYGSFQIISASPERFLRVQDRIVETRPIKGTRRRGFSEEEDLLLKEELLNSEKDKSELLMIVDLERNDLNRVCEPGSVLVTDNFALETYSTVHHLVSTVRGKLRNETSVIDLLKASFPGGSITGAPKIRAMQIIDELEGNLRGLYTGTIGYFSLDGNCDFNIIIRTAIYHKGIYHLGVGGGITYESDSEFEYDEMLQKARALLDALGCPVRKG